MTLARSAQSPPRSPRKALEDLSGVRPAPFRTKLQKRSLTYFRAEHRANVDRKTSRKFLELLVVIFEVLSEFYLWGFIHGENAQLITK